MTLAEVEAFLAVADSGTISEAAETLFLSQSTLSGRIASLEGELGGRLFERGKGIRNTELTERGRRFLPVAEQWRKLWRETLALRDEGRVRELRTSAVHSINQYILPAVYRRFAQENPDVRLWLRIRHSVDSYALVESGDVEAALVTKRRFSRRVAAQPLWRERMVFLSGWEETGNVRPQDLDPGRQVMLDWSEEFLAWNEYWFGAGRAPKVYTDDMGLMEEFLHTGGAWTVAPLSAAGRMCRSGALHLSALSDGPQDRVVYLLTRGRAERSGELETFLGLLREAVTNQGAQWLAENGTAAGS